MAQWLPVIIGVAVAIALSLCAAFYARFLRKPMPKGPNGDTRSADAIGPGGAYRQAETRQKS